MLLIFHKALNLKISFWHNFIFGNRSTSLLYFSLLIDVISSSRLLEKKKIKFIIPESQNKSLGKIVCIDLTNLKITIRYLTHENNIISSYLFMLCDEKVTCVQN